MLTVVLATVGLVVFSPFVLNAVSPDGQVDWERLSSIGQTYGAASAILAVLALAGVAISLVLQTREAKATREQALRMLHVDLLKIALEDPTFLRSWGSFSSSADEDEQREHIYVNLIVSFWQMRYEIDALGEPLLRASAASLFAGPVGRRFWRDARDVRLRTATGRRARRFHEILDEEYQQAATQEAQRPPEHPSRAAVASPGYSRSRSWQRLGVPLAGGVLVGFGAGVLLRRRSRRGWDRRQSS